MTTDWSDASTVIRDSLYDRIPITKPALALISAQPFLRLDRIQQLGFVSRIWPGAKHTRTSRFLAASRLTLTGPPTSMD